MTDSSLAELSVGELLCRYAETLAELRARGVTRTNNAPAGDYAEWLCASALDGKIADNRSEKSYDIVLASGETVQVKSRVVSTPIVASQIKTSPFRSWGFDHAALVLFREADYVVHAASLVPVATAQAHATWVGHVNGHVLRVTPALLADPTATDITEGLRRAAQTA